MLNFCKPSGTVSQLVDSSSGCHPRWSEYYIRTVRGDNNDPLTQFLKDQGVPSEPVIGKEESTTAFYFYHKAPDKAVTRKDISAVDHLNTYLMLQEYWCEHKPSITVNVHEHEWMEAGSWVYNHFDKVSGVAFLPYDGGSYKQAPYQEIDKDTYTKNYKELELDWDKLDAYEAGLDTTKGAASMACSGDVCEIVDIT